MHRIGNVVKKRCAAAAHPSCRGRAIKFKFRSRMQRRRRHRRAREEGSGLGEDRVGGAGGGHAAGVELLRRAAAQEQVLRCDLEHNL